MTKEELIQFLKENMKLEISNYWKNSGVCVNEISIFIGDKKITSDQFFTESIMK